MKLTKEEIKAVAQHIHNEVSKKNKYAITKKDKKILENLKKAYKQKVAEISKIEASWKNNKATILSDMGVDPSSVLDYWIGNTSYNDSFNRVIEKANSAHVPSIDTIQRELTFNNLIEENADIKGLIKKYIDKYAKS